MCNVHTTSRPTGGENSERSDALGNITNSAYPEQRENGVSRMNKGYVAKKYEAQNMAATVLNNDYAEWRTSRCLRVTIGDNVGVYASCDSAHYGGLMTCGSVWLCPVCAAKINMRRALEIEEIISKSDCTVLLITWTIQHTLKDKLVTILNDLKDTLRYTRNGSAKKRLDEELDIEGYIRAIEIRWSDRNGHHPHSHEALLINKPKNEIDIEKVKAVLSKRYHKKLRELGYYVNEESTVDVRFCHPNPKKNETMAQAAARYLTKSAIHLELTAGQEKGAEDCKSFSPFQLLDMYSKTGDLYYADLFTEYAHATKGKRQLTFSRGLKAKYLIEEKTDEEIVNEQSEDALPVCTIDKENWRKVLDKHLRAQILIEAALRSETLIEWLESHNIHATIPIPYEGERTSQDEIRQLVEEALKQIVIPA